MRGVWKLLFGRYLLVTNTISSGVLMLAGDVAAQEIERRQEKTTSASEGLERQRACKHYCSPFQGY